MKKNIFLFFVLYLLILTMLIISCSQVESGDKEGTNKSKTDPASINESATGNTLSNEMLASAAAPLAPNYELKTVPTITNFSMGWPGLLNGVAEPVHTVPLISSFRIGKTEVTYETWYTVREWALSNGYHFQNLGTEGNSLNNSTPTSRKNHPVTRITWRDAIVWCNAFSQMSNLTPCYQYEGNDGIIKDSRDSNGDYVDNAVCNWDDDGYRLPTEAQWEAAARYVNGFWWTPGNWASGTWADNNWWKMNVAWYTRNANGDTHPVGQKWPNALGIHDMSGNLFEMCWDWRGTYTNSSPYTDPNPTGPTSRQGSWGRISRGGAWDDDGDYQECSWRVSAPLEGDAAAYNCHGIRLSRKL